MARREPEYQWLENYVRCVVTMAVEVIGGLIGWLLRLIR
jgi:hypothetical protein